MPLPTGNHQEFPKYVMWNIFHNSLTREAPQVLHNPNENKFLQMCSAFKTTPKTKISAVKLHQGVGGNIEKSTNRAAKLMKNERTKVRTALGGQFFHYEPYTSHGLPRGGVVAWIRV